LINVTLKGKSEKYGIIVVNSFLHHVPDYMGMIRENEATSFSHSEIDTRQMRRCSYRAIASAQQKTGVQILLQRNRLTNSSLQSLTFWLCFPTVNEGCKSGTDML